MEKRRTFLALALCLLICLTLCPAAFADAAAGGGETPITVE